MAMSLSRSELIELCGIRHEDLEDALTRVRNRYMKLLREGKTHDSALVDEVYRERIGEVKRLKGEYEGLIRAL